MGLNNVGAVAVELVVGAGFKEKLPPASENELPKGVEGEAVVPLGNNIVG